MLNRWNANPMTPNPGLWLVESTEASYEYWWEHISYAYLANVKIMNTDELNMSFNVKPRPLRSRSSHALLTTLVLLTTYPLTQSLGGACCFDRPPQGGAWYTCPVLIVRSSLNVYKPWWDRAGEIVVWGQIGASPDISDTSQNAQIPVWYVVMISLRPCLTPYDWLLYRTLNIPIDELTWETCFTPTSSVRLTDMLVSRVVYTVHHVTDLKIDERQMMTHRDISIALTSWTICSCHVWCIPYVTWLIYVWPLRHELCLYDDFSLSLLFFPLCQGWGAARKFFTDSSDSIFHPPRSLVFFFQSSSCILHISLKSSRLALGLPRLLLPSSRNSAALFGSLSSAILSTCPAHCSLLLTRLSVKLLCAPVSSLDSTILLDLSYDISLNVVLPL